MNFKDLSLLNKILVIALFIVITPLLLFAVALTIIIVPFEYPKYRRSRYYKRYKQKYSIGITTHDSYKTINFLEKKNIHYDSFDIEKEELTIRNTIYLFSWFEYISFNDEGECIIAEQDNYEPTLLSEDLKAKGRENIKIVINQKNFSKFDLEKARKNKMLLIYNKISDLGKELKG